MIDLRPELLEMVKKILNRIVPGATVLAFGSRVAGTAKKHSDLDLVVITDNALPQKQYYQLKDAFEESELPIKVDVLDWCRISPEFKRNIQQRYEVIVSAEKGAVPK